MSDKKLNKNGKKDKKTYFWKGATIVGKNKDKEIEYYVPPKMLDKKIYYWAINGGKKQQCGMWKYSVKEVADFVDKHGDAVMFAEIDMPHKILEKLYMIGLLNCQDIISQTKDTE